MSLHSSPVRAAAIQMRPIPGDVEENLRRIGAMTREAAAEGAKLVVVPETATTGYFILDRLQELAEPEDGPTAARLAALARECSLHLAVGMAIVENGRFFDAQLLFAPDGRRLATYKKLHLFSAEREWYASGDRPVVVETEIGRIGMTICYDLIFPEYIRKLVDLGADLIINSTNWISDEFQRDTWDWTGPMVEALARTRALENGVWLAMANCTGMEAGFESLGHSCVAAPSGKLLSVMASEEGVAVGDILYESDDLTRWRNIATYRSDRRTEHYG